MRALVIVLGDQLDRRSAALDGFDPARDAIWMAEVVEESTHVWSAKQRIAVFLAGMRHFRDDMAATGRRVLYRQLARDALAPGVDPTQPEPAEPEPASLAEALAIDVAEHLPERLVVVQPGEYRVLQALQGASDRLRVPLEVRPDRHHLCSIERFAAHAAGRRQLRRSGPTPTGSAPRTADRQDSAAGRRARGLSAPAPGGPRATSTSAWR